METVPRPYKQTGALHCTTVAWNQVDCRDVAWPRAMRNLCLARGKARMGNVTEIVSNLFVTPEKLRSWCDTMGNHLIRMERDAGVFVAHV